MKPSFDRRRVGDVVRKLVSITQLSARLDCLEAAIQSLREEVQQATAKAAWSQEIIDRLEQENHGLKRRDSERRQEPLIKAVISLFDDMHAVAVHTRWQAGKEPELLESLLVFERQALDALKRNQVDAFEPSKGEPFNAARQEAWETVEAASRDQDMRVADVLRLGFEFGGRVVRPAAVKVYRFRDPIVRGETR